MKKYEYRISAFGKNRQDNAKDNKVNTKKLYKGYSWKAYATQM